MGEGLLTIFFQAWQVHYSPDLVGTMAATLTLHTTGPVDSNQGLWRGLKGSNSSLLNYWFLVDSGEGQKSLSSVAYTSMNQPSSTG